MKNKPIYRVSNWPEYNKNLVKRGSITFWIDEKTIKGWFAKSSKDKKGRPFIYGDEAILCALSVKSVYHLSFRALEGFLMSIKELSLIGLLIPCYTSICRRAKKLGKSIKKLTRNSPTDIVFDSTGVKLYGKGEWDAQKHGKAKRRIWRKIHLGVCPDSQKIIVSSLTKNNVTDAKELKKLVKELPKSVKRVYADGAYDQSDCYKELYEREAILITPPRKGAHLKDLKQAPWMIERNKAVKDIRKAGNNYKAREAWEKKTNYNIRSLAETAMYRFKRFFSGKLYSRNLEAQKVELYVKSMVMNKITDLGMPESVWVAA